MSEYHFIAQYPKGVMLTSWFFERITFCDEVDFIDDKVDMRKIPKY